MKRSDYLEGSSRRWPAEWEAQDAVLLCWPHAKSDWAPILDAAESTFLQISQAIVRFQRLVVIADDVSRVRVFFHAHGLPLDRVLFFEGLSDDTWARDFGPITVLEDGEPILLDFQFNGWGGKFPSTRDNMLTTGLSRGDILGDIPVQKQDVVLEGGSIESDGAGMLLTTTQCLLNSNRNSQCSKEDLELYLSRTLGIQQFVWLKNGFLAGDDTDAHIDTLVRLCPDRTIVYVACNDPSDEHFQPLKEMEKELKQLGGYRLIPLPWPEAKFAADGHRLPATYANFLVINEAVLVPTYQDAADQEAQNVIAHAFPGREVIGIDCCTLIQQHGSLHCVTMQLPHGVLYEV